MADNGCERDKYGRYIGRYTAEEFTKRASEYFETTEQKKQNIANFCVFMGISYNTYKKYLDSDEAELKEAADWAATRLQDKFEFALSNNANSTGPIFILKQKPFGFKDNQDVEVKGTGTFNIISNIPRPKEK